MRQDAWIRTYHSGRDGAPRLVCFPHAGGAASFYFPLSARLAPDIEAVAVQYPGRQDRRTEPPARGIADLADRIAAALTGWDDRPLALFGHSMGALVAFEVARRLEAGTGRGPTVLFASGRRAPTCAGPEDVRPQDTDAEVVRKIRALGGTDERLLADAELLPLVLPIVRADYRALDGYAYVPGPPLTCPIVALAGESDPVSGVELVRPWAERTRGGFALRVFPGGHFFLLDRPAEVADLISSGLSAYA